MKILALMHGSWLGGAQVSTLEFLRLLRDKVWLKILMCSSVDENLFSQVESLNIDIRRVPCKTAMGYPVMDVESVRNLIEWADIVWITDIEYLAAPRIKRVRKVPVVAHLHSYALICPWWGALYGFREVCMERCSLWRITGCKQGINLELAEIGLLSGGRARLYWFLDFAKGPLDFLRWRRLTSGVLESIDGFIAVSKAVCDIHLKHVPELKSKPSAIIYNPVVEPLNYVNPDPSEPYGNYIVYASGPNPVKGPHILLEAWSKISKELKDVKLYMTSCRGSWVEGLAKRMSLSNVVFFDKLPSNRYYSMTYKAKVVVMPSIWPEPFGRIPVEANRLGVPAIVSSSGGLPEVIVDGVTGYVYKFSDANDLAEKIMKSLEKDWDRGTIMQNSYKRINPRREVEKLRKFLEGMSSEQA